MGKNVTLLIIFLLALIALVLAAGGCALVHNHFSFWRGIGMGFCFAEALVFASLARMFCADMSADKNYGADMCSDQC